MTTGVGRPAADGPPRVAFFAATLEAGNGGIGRWARTVARTLARAGRTGRIRPSVWSWLDRVPPTGLNIDVRVCRGSRARFAAAVARAGLRHRYVIYDQLGLARAHRLIPFSRRFRLVLVHGIEVWDGARADYLRSAAAADALLTNSHYTRARAEALHGGFARTRVCWLGTERDDPAPPPAAPPPPRVLMISRVDDEYKGHARLIDCWPRVTAAVPAARLTFAGKGSRLNDVRARAAASPAAAAIDVRGFVPDDELDALYDSAAVFAMPSRGEGFGLVYVEAMRHGLPVVASVHDAGQEVNVDGVTGYNVDLDRPDELPDRLIRLLTNPTHAAELGAAARRRWAEHFRASAFETRLDVHLTAFWTGAWDRST